jgi:hypothetical protein
MVWRAKNVYLANNKAGERSARTARASDAAQFHLEQSR